MKSPSLKFIIAAFLMPCSFVHAQDTLRYTGKTIVNVDYHHGQLPPAVGVHNIQVFRADRSNPDKINGLDWTYSHQPMLAYWNNRFYLQYLSNPVGEHVPPGQTLLTTSAEGEIWDSPKVIFPPYKIADGTRKEGIDEVAKNLTAVMHQRMSFFVSGKNRLLALGYYGISFNPKDGPNDGNGIGRVVREILPDGKFGPIYFINYNHLYSEKNTNYPNYKRSKDKGFIAACTELLNNTLMVQQWAEESDNNDPLIKLKGDYKAFSYYHLPDNRVVGLWKNGLTSISKDEGKTWEYKPVRAPKVVNSNAKIWGQRTSDGKFVTVYNPSEFRWPLAVSVSNDGLNYEDLLLVHGEITAMRYGGSYKSYGPQYVRGIEEGNGVPPDKKLWVTYSVNKEDIWVSSIPLPVKAKADRQADEVFNAMPDGKELADWNTYSPLRAPVKMGKMPDGNKALSLNDFDPFDYAKAERVIPAVKKLIAAFSVVPQQNDNGLLNVEFQDARGSAGIRLSFDDKKTIKLKAGYRNKNLMEYVAGQRYDIEVKLDVDTRLYTVSINGQQMGNSILFAPLESVSRIVFKTGDVVRFPNADTPTDQDYDLPDADGKVKPAGFYLSSVKTKIF
ncbi:exo-alpha-sialidase [Pedobacter heparinus]|uniref:exo-alpha-sialidase n=1 Tax=Pedobacter heparinus TaxID=984 RepID=UPI00292E7362|nr:exo-alpha-sialidase [Pedobacter heparinus]